jgi:hypothetical protein
MIPELSGWEISVEEIEDPFWPLFSLQNGMKATGVLADTFASAIGSWTQNRIEP